ncbi:UpxZ family transcription anti-terminator antagonist, partial [Bacteroides thetaiotaomicron]
MGTFNNSIQEKIEKLQKTVDTLLHMGENMDCICVDDLSLLNKEIHEQINDLYPCHGKTAEQEAALCLSLLMGYSVSMYANSEDEAK